ncbi:hypothetical protein D1872_334000 [compost metagenome]
MRNVFAFQHRQGGHDLRHTGFIIRAQQRFAVGGDNGLAQKLMQHREHHRREHLVANTQRDIATTVILHNLRVDVLTAKIR